MNFSCNVQLLWEDHKRWTLLNFYFFVLRILVDLFRYKSLECITDSTFQCKGYEAQRVIRLHISFEHFEPKSPGKKIFTGPSDFCPKKQTRIIAKKLPTLTKKKCFDPCLFGRVEILVLNFWLAFWKKRWPHKGEQDSQIWMPECDSFPRFSR